MICVSPYRKIKKPDLTITHNPTSLFLSLDPMAALRGLTLGQPGPRPAQQPTPPLGQHSQLSQVQQTQQQLQINLARQQQAQATMQRQQQIQRQLHNHLSGPPPPAPPLSQQSVMQQQMFNPQQAAAIQAQQQMQNMQVPNDPQQQAMKVSLYTIETGITLE